MTEALDKGKQKSAQTGIHMQRQIVSQGQFAQGGNRIDCAVRIRRSGGQKQNRISVDQTLHGLCIGAKVFIHRRTHHFYVEVFGCFFPGHMNGFGCDHFRLKRKTAQLSGPFAAGEDGQKTAFRPARSHDTRHPVVAVEESRRHLHDFRFHAFEAFERQGIERVFAKIKSVSLPEKRGMRLSQIVHKAPDFAVAVVGVTGRKRRQLLQRFLMFDAVLRYFFHKDCPFLSTQKLPKQTDKADSRIVAGCLPDHPGGKDDIK